MDVKVDIDAEAINKHVADAIIDSAIGETLREEINNQVKALSKPIYDNPLKKVIEAEISKAIYQIVMKEMSDDIRKAAREQLTDKILIEFCSKALDAMLEKQ